MHHPATKTITTLQKITKNKTNIVIYDFTAEHDITIHILIIVHSALLYPTAVKLLQPVPAETVIETHVKIPVGCGESGSHLSGVLFRAAICRVCYFGQPLVRYSATGSPCSV